MEISESFSPDFTHSLHLKKVWFGCLTGVKQYHFWHAFIMHQITCHSRRKALNPTVSDLSAPHECMRYRKLKQHHKHVVMPLKCTQSNSLLGSCIYMMGKMKINTIFISFFFQHDLSILRFCELVIQPGFLLSSDASAKENRKLKIRRKRY